MRGLLYQTNINQTRSSNNRLDRGNFDIILDKQVNKQQS